MNIKSTMFPKLFFFYKICITRTMPSMSTLYLYKTSLNYIHLATRSGAIVSASNSESALFQFNLDQPRKLVDKPRKHAQTQEQRPPLAPAVIFWFYLTSLIQVAIFWVINIMLKQNWISKLKCARIRWPQFFLLQPLPGLIGNFGGVGRWWCCCCCWLRWFLKKILIFVR